MAGKFIGIVYRVGETMSQDKTIESAGNAVSENLPNLEASETLAATMEGQHIPAEAPNEGAQQSLALNNVNDIEPADEKIKLAKKDDKDEEGRDKQEAEAVQIVSETVSEQHGAQAQNDSAYVEQDMEGYSFLEGVSGAESGYALGAAGICGRCSIFWRFLCHRSRPKHGSKSWLSYLGRCRRGSRGR